MVDWGGLENRCACKRTVGSNPTLSANFPVKRVLRPFGWPEKAQVSCGFPGKPVDRQGRNERRNRLSGGPVSPDLWTWAI